MWRSLLLLVCACSTGGRTLVDLTEACAPLAARVCRCDEGGEGVQLCGDNGRFQACDCTLSFSAALCPPEYEIGQEALCVGAAATCALAIAGSEQTFNAQTIGAVTASVTTNLEDGDAVVIEVDGKAVGQAIAVGGAATLANLALGADGEHRVVARCKTQRGLVTESTPVLVRSDVTPPPLTFVQPEASAHFAPNNDSNARPGVQLDVCVQSSATDIASFCVALDDEAQGCLTSAGCLSVDCPGGAPFSVSVYLADKAGNSTLATHTNVSCSLFVPSVAIVSPGGGTGADPTTHLLAAETAQALRDQDAAAAGAQWDVRACTDASAGIAELRAGLAGGTIGVIATAPLAVADVADNCPVGKPYVARFDHATLPESTAFYTGALDRATRLEVNVTDLSAERGTSPEHVLWVDSIPPTIAGDYNFCGVTANAAGTYNSGAVFYSSLEPPPLFRVIDQDGDIHDYANPTRKSGIILNYGNVPFEQGASQVFLIGSEASGNAIRWPSPCVFTVVDDFVVYLVRPDSGVLNLQNDADHVAPWQGIIGIEADTEAAGTVVELTIDGVSGPTGECDGAAVPTWSWLDEAYYGGYCRAEITVGPLSDGPHTLVATVKDGASTRPDTSITRMITVDATPPAAPSNVAVSIVNRRESRFHLAWPAPEAGLTYEVRSAPLAITGPTGVSGTISFAEAERFSVSTVAGAAGTLQGVDVPLRTIEVEHTFALVAKDAAGNTSGIVAATGRATFNRTVLASPAPTGQMFGAYTGDGSADINGDGFGDLLIPTGAGGRAYAFFGSPSGFTPTPNVTFTGLTETFFAQQARTVGDFDGDGIKDVGMAATQLNEFYVFRGRATWPSEVLSAEADLTIRVDTAADPLFNGSYFGTPVTPCGDMNGDGAQDFAVAAYFYNAYQGAVFVVFGSVGPQTWPQEIVLPRDIGTRAAAIYGLPNYWEQQAFGGAIAAVTPFFGGGRPALLINGLEWTGSDGDIYSYAGGPGFGGSYQHGSYTETLAGEQLIDGAAWFGSNYTLVGPLAGAQAIAVAAPRGGNVNNVIVFTGTEGTGLFARARQIRIFDSLDFSNSIQGNFGSVMAGGNFMGTSEPDLMATSYLEQGGGPSPLFLFDGATLRSAIGGADLDARTAADVRIDLDPALAWEGTYPESGTVVRDLDGDGYDDFAIAGVDFFSTAQSDGRVIVFW